MITCRKRLEGCGAASIHEHLVTNHKPVERGHSPTAIVQVEVMTLDPSHGESERRGFTEMLVKKEDEISALVIRMQHLTRPGETRTDGDNATASMSVVVSKDTRIGIGETANAPIRKRKAEPGEVASKSLCCVLSHAIGFKFKDVRHWTCAMMPNRYSASYLTYNNRVRAALPL
jgi:hypothetical protein